MPRSSTPRFANLRAWLEWLTDEGKVSSCCRSASEDEIRERPETFDCSRCQRLQRFFELWPENVVAWDCYQALAGRTVRDVHGGGAWTLQRFTAGWSWQRITDLLARVDLILEMLMPVERPPEGHGRRTAL